MARRAWRALGTFGVTLALVAGTPPSARAEDDATIAMARERFKEGVQFFDQKQYDKARAAFLQAYALKRHPAVLLNLAQSELRSDHETDAAKHFAQYLREHKDASDAERQSAEAGLAAAKAKVAEVTVTADEEGATIAVDGTVEGQSPLPGPLFLKPGSRTITAKKDGREATTQVALNAGQATSATLRLRKATTVAPAPKPRATPEPPPTEATVKPAPSPEPNQTVGERLEADTSDARGREPFFRWAAHSPVAWVGGSLTLLGVAGGVGFAIASRQSYADADTIAQLIRKEAARRNPPLATKGICGEPGNALKPPSQGFEKACDAYTDNVDDGDDFKTASWISVGVGAVALGGTVVYYLVAAPQRDDARSTPKLRIAHIAPVLTPDLQGISLGGSF